MKPETASYIATLPRATDIIECWVETPPILMEYPDIGDGKWTEAEALLWLDYGARVLSHKYASLVDLLQVAVNTMALSINMYHPQNQHTDVLLRDTVGAVAYQAVHNLLDGITRAVPTTDPRTKRRMFAIKIKIYD